MFCLHNTSIYPITLDLRKRGKRSVTEIKTIWKLQVFRKPKTETCYLVMPYFRMLSNDRIFRWV